MLRIHLRVAPFAVACLASALATNARADEQQGQGQLMQAAPPTVQLQPLPPTQQGPTIIVQQPYPGQIYQAPQYPQGPTYYGGQAPTPTPAPLGPRIIHEWDESQPIPAGYHQEEHVRKGLVIGGAVLFGTVYLLTGLGASIANDTGTSANALYVPGLGPFIQIAQSQSATGGFFLALDGLAQLGGIAMFAVGLAYPQTELVRNDFGLSLHLAPIVARDHQGMGLVGTF